MLHTSEQDINSSYLVTHDSETEDDSSTNESSSG